ncbi:hypothetical protein [Photobacterium sp. Alg240-V54]|uniref:glucosamine inositolphosphorylceramide transferase family protein n=1 Tax=Photobacterium sp. Alg240-V54 TaxID=2305995 RepID=UPI0013D3B9B5|nr:hypothetical protein [Photobacterium sp. Alg240-V54]
MYIFCDYVYLSLAVYKGLLVRKLKVGVLLDDDNNTKQIYDFLDVALDSKVYDVKFTITHYCFFKFPSIKEINISLLSNIYLFIKKLFLKLVIKFEVFLLIKNKKIVNNYFFKINIKNLSIRNFNIYNSALNGDFFYRYTEDEIIKIRRENVDLLIHYGSKKIPDELLKLFPSGVISLNYTNTTFSSSLCAGFYDVLNKHDTTSFSVKVTNYKLKKIEDVIFNGSIMTSFMFTLNLIRLYSKSNSVIHKLVENIASKRAHYHVVNQHRSMFPSYSVPSISVQILYLYKLFCCCYIRAWRSITSKTITWGVAYQFTDSWCDVSLSESTIIENPDNHYLADPFIIKQGNKHYCFVEDYDFAVRKGLITVYEIDPKGYKYLGVALEEEFHLSYPYLFRDGDNLYMCPESCSAKDIRLYKCVNFPLEWKLEKILIKNISAADTNIVKVDSTWWMMSNVDSSLLGNDHYSELHLFYSKDLLNGDWVEHKSNPVIYNASIGRNGGLFFDDENIYRVYQIQGCDLYGKSFGVSKVNEISRYKYEEDIQFEVAADYFDSIVATHTFNFTEGLIVLDFAKIDTYIK